MPYFVNSFSKAAYTEKEHMKYVFIAQIHGSFKITHTQNEQDAIWSSRIYHKNDFLNTNVFTQHLKLGVVGACWTSLTAE